MTGGDGPSMNTQHGLKGVSPVHSTRQGGCSHAMSMCWDQVGRASKGDESASLASSNN